MANGMRFPALGETDLLVPLHEGLFEQPMWQTFLARLRAVTGAAGAGMLLEGSETVELVSGALAAGQLARLVAAQAGLREGRTYALEELQPTDAPSIADVRLLRVSGEAGLSAVLALADDDALTAAIGSVLTALAPHLGVALRTLATLERERTRASLSEGVVARMNFGWISLDQRGRIVDLNAPAERLLQLSGLLRRGAYDRLVPASALLDRELARLVARCAQEPDMRPHALTLSQDPWIDLLVTPIRVAGLGAGGQAVAMVYLRGDRTSQADRQEQLVDLFQLTPSEARLAWSMAQGLSIADAASQHGLTVETARYYSKKIYAKTGARGQSDLVRHILTGVLALA